ncbi:MAG: family 1 glycosylhydrolase [Armatimonadota bacterium]
MTDNNHQVNNQIEIWGGVECTVNRVGNDFYDQLERNGHSIRIDDLVMFADLGIKAIRYPVLWERVAPISPTEFDWKWSDDRLNLLRTLDIRPIIGLLHHGSGPMYTSLIDPDFPRKFADYARAVAERYPWVENYTPINEPLTTARFSCLYGFWYPHMKDERAFGQAILNQCRGISMAMSEIRNVNTNARLIQTEDLGKVWSTPHMAYQAKFDNLRRWLSFDILCGKLKPEHPMWQYLDMYGIEPDEIKKFADNPCIPDIVGINHYITSERFLDEHLEHYPEHYHGGNFQEPYVDIEAVRVSCEAPAGPKKLLREAWDRYNLPIAVTECHIGCSREEQMRWFWEVWNTARSLRMNDIDIRAVTAWSLLGAYDWNSTLTRCDCNYESGVYDAGCSKSPKPTVLAKMIRSLAKKSTYDHSLLDVPGWWHRPERLHYFPAETQPESSDPSDLALQERLTRPVLITGATGTLGSAFARICDNRAIPYDLLTRQDMDITDIESVEKALELYKPWAVINTAGYARVDDAENEPDICRMINAKGPENLAKLCARENISLVTISSDLVFNGKSNQPYIESDRPQPLNVYGMSKLEGEQLVLNTFSSALIIRTSAFFGPWDEYNFITNTLTNLSKGMQVYPAMDSTVSPTYLPDLVNTILDLMIDEENGIWHVANNGAVTWHDLAIEAARRADLNTRLIQPRRTCDLYLQHPDLLTAFSAARNR